MWIGLPAQPLPVAVPLESLVCRLSSGLQSTLQVGSDHADVCPCRWSRNHDATGWMLKRDLWIFKLTRYLVFDKIPPATIDIYNRVICFWLGMVIHRFCDPSVCPAGPNPIRT